MDIDKRLYNVAGVTVDKKLVAKVRYSTEEFETRIKMYENMGCKALFIELPEPMNKIDICKYLRTVPAFDPFDAEIEAELLKKRALVEPKVPKKRGRPPKAKTAGPAVVASKTVAKQPKNKPAVKASTETLAAPADEDLAVFEKMVEA